MQIHCKFDEMVDPKKLKHHPSNRNKHSADQINRLVKLYQGHGIRHPIIVSKQSGFIVAGHARKQAAHQAKMKEFPVVYQDFESPDLEYAFIQSDNSIALWAELDLAGINSDLPDLGPDFDIDLLGIKDFVIEPLDKLEPQCDEDEIPDTTETRCKSGDIWKLGAHRLMCGDSTSITDVEKLMGGEKPLLMVTDPPYGVKLDQSWRDDVPTIKKLGKGNANLVANDDRADWYDVWAICNAQIAYVWHASVFSDVVMDSLRRAGYEVKQQIIWNKSVLVMGRQAYHWKHEPCWYAVRES